MTSVEDELENKCRQRRQPITSPLTGLELPTTNLMPLVAVQKAIEAYMAHRPQLKSQQSAKRSFAAMRTAGYLRNQIPSCSKLLSKWRRGAKTDLAKLLVLLISVVHSGRSTQIQSYSGNSMSD